MKALLARLTGDRKVRASLHLASRLAGPQKLSEPSTFTELADVVREDEEPLLCWCGRGYVGHEVPGCACVACRMHRLSNTPGWV